MTTSQSQLIRSVPKETSALLETIEATGNLKELQECIPELFKPRFQLHLKRVYSLAKKYCTASEYLENLQIHLKTNTFPTDIERRVRVSSFQNSKEFFASASSQKWVVDFTSKTNANKLAMLRDLISMKEEEVSFLKDLFSQDKIDEENRVIFSEALHSYDRERDAMDLDNPDITSLSGSIKKDTERFAAGAKSLCERATALAHMEIQKVIIDKKLAHKMNSMTVESVEAQDSATRNQTVDDLVAKAVGKALKDQQYSKKETPKGKGARKGEELSRTPKKTKPAKVAKPRQKGVGKGKGRKGKGKKGGM